MIEIKGGTAYVDTVTEAFEAADITEVQDVVIRDNMERIKMNKIVRAFGR